MADERRTLSNILAKFASKDDALHKMLSGDVVDITALKKIFGPQTAQWSAIQSQISTIKHVATAKGYQDILNILEEEI